MKQSIRAYIAWNEYHHIHYYKDFEIVDNLPEFDACEFAGYTKKDDDLKILEINPIALDSEQGRTEVYDYDYFQIVIQFKNLDDELEKEIIYIAIEKKEEVVDED